MYNTLVSRCFDSCVTSFRSKTLDKSESLCVDHCACTYLYLHCVCDSCMSPPPSSHMYTLSLTARYVKMTQRVGLRFAEHQALQQQRAEQLQKTGGN
jgi:hypothetical protein